MKKPQFVNGEIYHVYNRGVEKRTIFLENRDYFRFIHDLFEFNNQDLAPNNSYFFNNRNSHGKNEILIRNPRKILVEILSFCLMPNHFHLMLRQISDNGVIKFMHRLGTGYTNFFNKKQERVGPLFQGRFKAVLVNDEVYLRHLLNYIHANPLDIKFTEWRGKQLQSTKSALNFLENYRWSSFQDYIGKRNFSSVSSRSFCLRLLGGAKEYKESLQDWLQSVNLEEVEEYGFVYPKRQETSFNLFGRGSNKEENLKDNLRLFDEEYEKYLLVGNIHKAPKTYIIIDILRFKKKK